MNGKKLLIGLSYIDRKYIEESEQDMPVRNAITTTINQNKAQLKCLSTKKIWLIAAVIALTLLLVGCAIIYARWSSGLEDWFRPSNTIRQQAEQSGLSVIYPQDQIQEDGLSATDQGITVSVKQTIVDQWRASIVLKIEGFELPDGVRPCFYGERPLLTEMLSFVVLPVIISMTESSQTNPENLFIRMANLSKKNITPWKSLVTTAML